MKKVLIIGMTSILGGVETYLYNVVKFLDKKDIEIDFLVIGDSKKAVFENELVNILGCNKKHFYYTPSVKKNPIKAVKWLRGFYQAKMYDVIYMNTCTSARIVYCSYAINKLGAKLITHSHNGNAISKFKGINNRIFSVHCRMWNMARKLKLRVQKRRIIGCLMMNLKRRILFLTE